jgi:hypothetical protein
VEPASASKPKRTIEEAVHYALGARVRVEILTILNDGPASHSELAKLTGLGVSRIGHHIQEMVDSGCIELAGIERARNQNVHIYRAVERAFVSDEQAEQLSDEANNEIAAYILQAIMAEALASLWAGKLNARQRKVWAGWRAMNLDAQGQEELHEEKVDHYQRVLDIEARAADRLAESGETGTPTITASLSFERSREKRAPVQSIRGKTD